jgi:glucose-6-phosphate 1-dehydrogenase
VEASWEFLSPILRHWGASGAGPPVYPAGSWGPAEADRLIERTGHHWLNPDDQTDSCRGS